MKLTTWLVWTTLATAVLAQPFRTARLGQRLCLLQGQRVCWSRPLGDGKVQTLTPEGLALISRGKTWVVVEPSGREQCQLVVPESFKVESPAFGADVGSTEGDRPRQSWGVEGP